MPLQSERELRSQPIRDGLGLFLVIELVDDGDHSVFLAGDSAYTQALMLRGKPDGVGADERAELLTHERIQAFAAENPTVYLVAHDPETGARLEERQVVHALPQEVPA